MAAPPPFRRSPFPAPPRSSPPPTGRGIFPAPRPTAARRRPPSSTATSTSPTRDRTSRRTGPATPKSRPARRRRPRAPAAAPAHARSGMPSSTQTAAAPRLHCATDCRCRPVADRADPIPAASCRPAPTPVRRLCAKRAAAAPPAWRAATDLRSPPVAAARRRRPTRSRSLRARHRTPRGCCRAPTSDTLPTRARASSGSRATAGRSRPPREPMTTRASAVGHPAEWVWQSRPPAPASTTDPRRLRSHARR